ncbi:MAG TPA: asparagine--tRNA ligase [Candidatus Eisenbacteria bacterium]|uniref:Asparagine--tRNA ligase n=1 Tax=Eiseniibacteriota bacterium TaxID=2212470 RepID=A0A7V2AUD7_UNCEI|nr:asparagine--tRNA ligase [Candidatus Eisenbacteria bacterium]
MNVVEVAGIGEFVGREVTLRGWVYNIRSSGKILFVLLRDGTGVIQSIVERSSIGGELFDAASKLQQESTVEVQGLVRADARAPGGYELGVTGLRVMQIAEDYPITPKEHGSTFLLDHRHLWLRSSRQHAILRIRASLIRFIREFFDNRGFVNLDTPILTPNACEGTTTLFETDYFGDKAYLTQSGQLYNEANAAAFRKVYCFGPTFRAEKSKTRRHLIEFWMVEPEVAFAGLEDIMQLAEDFVVEIVGRTLESHRDLLVDVLERDIAPLERVQPPFPRISYSEAAERLIERETGFVRGGDFGGGDETVLSEDFDRPFFVHRFPAAVKAFYMEPDPDDPALTLSVDLLAPEGYGEIIGGGERIHDLQLLERRIEEHGLPRTAFEWYIDLRRWGTFQHAGFGLGLERTVAYICGLGHLREAIPFPRLINRLSP